MSKSCVYLKCNQIQLLSMNKWHVHTDDIDFLNQIIMDESVL
jgi:hypothetical protein